MYLARWGTRFFSSRPCLSFKIDHSIDIYLRTFSKNDSEKLFRVVDDNRSYLRHWLPWVDSTLSEKDSLNFIEHSNQMMAQNKALVMGIWKDQTLLGTNSFISITRDDSGAEAEMGYWIVEKEQGKGIISCSSTALIKYGFEHLHLNRIILRCVDSNHKSKRIIASHASSLKRVEELQWVEGREKMTPTVVGNIARDVWLAETKLPHDRPELSS